MLLLADNRFIL